MEKGKRDEFSPWTTARFFLCGKGRMGLGGFEVETVKHDWNGMEWKGKGKTLRRGFGPFCDCDRNGFYAVTFFLKKKVRR